MEQRPIDGKITDDSVPNNMAKTNDYGLYKDDFMQSRRTEVHAGDYNNIGRKFNKLGNSLSKNKQFD